jgi:hypothetical protein
MFENRQRAWLESASEMIRKCSVFYSAWDGNEINSDIMKNEVDAAIRLVRFLKDIGVYEHI